MINLIVGTKGSGKTAKLVDQMNMIASDINRIAVCVVRGKRLETQIKPQVRLIDVDDYPVKGYRELLSFIAGICAKDYDLTDIYVDSISKIAQDDNQEALSAFLDSLDRFSAESGVEFTLTYSEDPALICGKVTVYCRK
jgi:predicted ATP-dependent serine protease